MKLPRLNLNTPSAVLVGSVLIAYAVYQTGWQERELLREILQAQETRPVAATPIAATAVAEQFSEAVRQHFVESDLRTYVMGKPRQIVEVAVDDVRFSKDNTQLQVDFALLCSDRTALRSSVVLTADDFGVYHGELPIDNKTASFAIK